MESAIVTAPRQLFIFRKYRFSGSRAYASACIDSIQLSMRGVWLGLRQMITLDINNRVNFLCIMDLMSICTSNLNPCRLPQVGKCAQKTSKRGFSKLSLSLRGTFTLAVLRPGDYVRNHLQLKSRPTKVAASLVIGNSSLSIWPRPLRPLPLPSSDGCFDSVRSICVRNQLLRRGIKRDKS